MTSWWPTISPSFQTNTGSQLASPMQVSWPTWMAASGEPNESFWIEREEEMWQHGCLMPHPIDAWHEFVRSRDPGMLEKLLAEDVVFHSPVVHTPQRGKPITLLYLRGAMEVLGSPAFRYEREIRGERDALLEFVTEIDGITINGVDLIRWDDAGRIVDFKVMVRPLKAVNILHQKMGELLAKLKPSAQTNV